ncbi:signal transduction histidine kinase [Salana multivorans]|uniref:Signal transduction histidine kinase n=1 Tax=Salana multivorans TaxID=120377 RepID=A0A3N2D0G0_9MICO|nr:GAF domain-containing protein [Salana multivorans]OJX94747.1 MAG: hypothetical protein BGO96_01390 [Micrococcales bacterium 73-15]ROR93138.1 signal transduction histidine kinase [Salana multivorans]
MSTPVTPALITQLLDLAGQLDAERALAELVVAAADHTGARYAAIAELDAYGETTTFIQQGMSAEEVAVLGHPPRGHGVLGTLPEGVLLLDDLTQHPAFEGFPPGHPPMHTFLGVPVMAGGIVLGRLYLTNKPSGFTPQDVETVTLLAAAAAVAMDNARLYRQAQDRERWMQVSQEITAALLEGTEEEDVLALIAQRIREVADADGAAIVLPSLDEEWMVEIVDGPRMAPLIGAVLPPDGPAIESVHTASGVLVDSIARDADRFIPEARIFERALYAPLLTHLADDDAGAGATTSSLGVLILFRLPGRPAFTEQDLAVAADFGRQAALALRLAAARHAEDIAALLNERSRIARDLHDLAIQQLFATGMRLEHAKKLLAGTPEEPTVVTEIDEAIGGVDEGVRQIRGIVRSLRDRDEQLPVLERLLREASLARASLGFAPSMLLTLDGEQLAELDTAGEQAAEIDARLGDHMSDDVVAVVREGLSNVARHAQATSARVVIDVEPRTVRIVVSDDGRGPEPASDRRSGLANLLGRAEDHGGAARLVANPGGGSSLVWEAWIG